MTAANLPHERRVGDTVKVLEAYLKYRDSAGDATAYDLSGKTVTFSMINKATGTAKVTDQAAVIVTAASGLVRYDFQSADVDTAGVFLGFFTVTDSGETDTYPAVPTACQVWIHGDSETAEQAYKRVLRG